MPDTPRPTTPSPTTAHTTAPATDDPAADPRSPTVSLISLGCPKNLVDSEKMLGLLAEDGYAPISCGSSGADHSQDQHAGGDEALEIDPADVVVVNTCGFLEASKDESLRVVRAAVEAKARGEVGRVVVAGCLVQRHRAKILDWVPGIDAMVGVFDRDKILDAARGPSGARESTAEVAQKGAPYWIHANALAKAKDDGLSTVGLTVHGKDGKGLGYFESDAARLRLTPRHYAYLRISEGCNQNCAFCTIPSIRGKMRSKPLERIEAETRELARDGAHELLLIGQDTTSYGDDLGFGLRQVDGHDRYRGGLPKLMRTVCDALQEEAGDGWVRLMYAYPTFFTDEIIDAMAELSETSALCKYLDIPLQHGSDRMLELMRRNVRAEQQLELVQQLRERIPGMAIRTTFITGFPGETERDHEQLMEFIDEVGFDAVGVFKYSTEPGTPAGTMAADASLAVDPETMDRRHDELMALQQGIAFEQAAFLAEQFDAQRPDDSGVRLDVLIDRAVEQEPGEDGGTLYQGRTYFQAPDIDAVTYVRSRRELSPGEKLRCAVVGSDGYDLIAKPEDELTTRVQLDVLG